MPQSSRDRLFLASIVKNIPAFIFVKEAKELRFELFNAAGEQLTGLTEDKALGKNDFDFFPQEQAEFFTNIDRRVLASRQLVDVAEEPIDTPAGKRWLHTRKVPVLGDDGEPRYLLGIAVDITDRKQAQDALAERNRELEAKEEELKATLGQLLALEELAVAAAAAGDRCRQIIDALDQGDTARARALAQEASEAISRARKAG